MNILLCGGKSEADYVLSAFRKHGNRIVIINEDHDTADLLSEHYGLYVINSDPTKIYSFEIADVTNFDLVVSLMEKDADNFVVCKIAKELFHIKKAICTVSNPNNVSIFQRLGIDSPISASYLLAERIRGESDVESIFRTLSLEDEKIVITEVKILESFPCVGQTLAELRLPNTGTIACIFRDPDVIIPRGNTTIQVGDTIVIASGQEAQEDLVDYFKFGPDEALQKQRAIQEEEARHHADEVAAEEIAKHETEIRQAVDAALASQEEQFQAKMARREEQLRQQIEEEAYQRAKRELLESHDPDSSTDQTNGQTADENETHPEENEDK